MVRDRLHAGVLADGPAASPTPSPEVPDEPSAAEPARAILRVRSAEQLDRWLELAGEAGWLSGPRDLAVRRRLYAGLGGGLGEGLGDGQPLRHWLVVEDHTAVGFASSFLDGTVLDLCSLGVSAPWRRRGLGRALVAARIADGAARGATLVVSAPSHDGWALQRTLGFRSVPVELDTCWYLPG